MGQSDATPAGDTTGDTTGDAAEDTAVPDPGWTWPPAGPTALVGTAHFATDEWAPPSTVRHPVVRVGRWTLLYRRAAPRRRARSLGAHLGRHLGRLCARVGDLRGHLHGRGSRRVARRR